MITTHIPGAVGGTLFGAIACLGALMLVFLLYARNKQWWGHSRTHERGCCNESCPPVTLRPVPPPPVPTPRPERNKLAKTYSFDLADSSSESEIGGLRKQTISSVTEPLGAFFPPSRHDLMSLVEKGRVGMSSNSSCCSSTTSSVGGEKHQDQRVVAQINDNTIKSISELRETKIDNQGINYNKSQTAPTLETVDNNANKDCIVVMSTDDRSELISCISQDDQSQPVASIPGKCGHLEIALLYDAPMRKMTVHVLQARDIPNRDRGQLTHTQVRLILLPSKKQKHKTKIRSGENPQFMESFLLHRVNPEDVNSMGLRLRLYGCERMRKERLIGETVVSFAHINLELENNFWLNLEPRSNTTLSSCGGDLMSLARSDSTGSTHSMQHGGVPELLLGLCYNATTGRLSVEVVKGSHFRNLSANRPPDTYVKLNLVSSTGQELAHSKTTVRRGQPNPLFKETFIFQVALFQLADVTLMISVYNRKGVTKRKEMVGWFSLGLNSSGAEELSHWMDMKEFQQEQICRWHVLVQS